MYMKSLLGLFYVLQVLRNADALPVTGQGAPTALNPDNVDQTMKEAVQTLLAGLIIKGNDLRAELQEEARSLMEDPYPFDDDTLAALSDLAAQEVAEARDPKQDSSEIDSSEDSGESGKASNQVQGATENTKSLRALADDTINEIKRFYGRSELLAAPAEHHNKFADFFHNNFANFFNPGNDLFPPYMDTPPVTPHLPTTPTAVVDPVVDVPPPLATSVPPVAPVLDVAPPVVPPPMAAPLPDVPPPVLTRSVESIDSPSTLTSNDDQINPQSPVDPQVSDNEDVISS